MAFYFDDGDGGGGIGDDGLGDGGVGACDVGPVEVLDWFGHAVVTFELTVNNVVPTIDRIAVPLDPVLPATAVSADATFSDPAGTEDEPHACKVDYGDETGEEGGTVDGTTCAGPNHLYAEPGVYVVSVTVTDKDGGSGSAEASEYVVVYDPEGGFVTGGGWTWSKAGYCKLDLACEDAEGKASFGFMSKYKKSAEVPTGQTQFQFRAGDLNFHSDGYDWLMVAGHKAKYKGTGMINGAGNYGFMISAIDEALTPSTDVDLFRIKIWDKADEVVVYDNQMGEAEDADPATAIGGGSIVIHKAK